MSGFLVGSPLIDPAVKRHNGGTSSLTLDNAGTTNSTLLFINGVAQVAGTDFTVSGTTLSTTTAIPAGTNIATTVQLAVTGTVNVPADASVVAAKLSSAAITGQTNGTVAVGDSFLFSDVNDSGNLKDDTIQGILDLAGGGLKSVQVFTSSGTWTKPSGINSVKVIVTGGGSAGAGGSASVGFSGGGAGGTAIEFIDVSGTSSETVTIGAGGTGGTGNGPVGASSSFGSFCSATGGSLTTAGSAKYGGLGGAGTGGNINIDGGDGGGNIENGDVGNGGASFWGGGGSCGTNTGSQQVGLAGQAYGTGGGGAGDSTYSGGSGKAGVIYVEEYT